MDRLIERALAGETVRSHDTPFQSSATGRSGWVVGTYAPHRDGDGVIVGVIATIQDMTERKRVEKAMRESEEKYHLVVENAREAIFIAQDGKIAFPNRATLEMMGYPEEILTAIPFTDLIHAEDRDFVHTNYLERIKGKELPSVYSFRLVRRDGSIRWVEINATRILWRGRPASLNFLNDITEARRNEEARKLLEERLQRAEKMEALGTLAGGVAHDLNNVLGVVVGYAEMLLNEIDESSLLRDDVLKILEGGQRSAAIVQDLLTLARRGVQTTNVFNLNTAIVDCQKTPEFEKISSFNPKVQIKNDLDTDLLNIMGSPMHLTKTIINLVANAMEAMPDGGVLTIKTSNQSLDKPVQGYDAVNEGDYVVLSIVDEGEGISDRNIKHIFEPFYSKKVMGKRSGTGLGLAVVWGTVKDHNGYIDVQSEEGKVTTFTLYFPVTREEITKEKTSIPLSAYIGNYESILVIDDIKEQRELAAKMLSKLSYKVTTVSSGEEAVEYLKTNKADLLILDMIMDPGMDGLDAYKAILEMHPEQKAIIVSGFSETDRVLEARRLGVGKYLRKPYVQEKLGMAVRKELDRK
ncbi:MAG: Sensor histidine kinase RcsC [Syntrophus sp. SKADARSKE-3]|nr:Sensor histidine kinase RcsC [Syntrophus sp. SKADARSKE-3]